MNTFLIVVMVVVVLSILVIRDWRNTRQNKIAYAAFSKLQEYVYQAAQEQDIPYDIMVSTLKELRENYNDALKGRTAKYFRIATTPTFVGEEDYHSNTGKHNDSTFKQHLPKSGRSSNRKHRGV